jgi:5-methylcytosine-specific restriction enzyme A
MPGARRNPDWVEDELILACDLVMQNGWRQLDDTNPQVGELSSLFRALPLHPEDSRLATFRNASGVARKTADIATAHPEYTGTPTHGTATSLGNVIRS